MNGLPLYHSREPDGKLGLTLPPLSRRFAHRLPLWCGQSDPPSKKRSDHKDEKKRKHKHKHKHKEEKHKKHRKSALEPPAKQISPADYFAMAREFRVWLKMEK